jgi:ABC-2 type transport system ATP-binding protein
VGAMLQTGPGSGLPPGVRVGATLQLARRLYRRPAPFEVTVERAGIGELLDRQTQRLSGGQVQSVRFAIAIAGDPELVFLDEPTAAMDVAARRSFWRMLRQFSREGRTVLFATHHLHEADQIADRAIVINHGRVVADGPGAMLKASVATRRVRFVSDRPNRAQLDRLEGVTDVEIHGHGVSLGSLDADATVRALVRERVAFTDLEVTGPALEDAFVALTEGKAIGRSA